MSEKQLPNNVEAEKGVLGSLLIDPEAIDQIIDFLLPEHFYRETHRTLYSAMATLYTRQEPMDFIMVCDFLEQQGKLEEIGGPGYITSLINHVPSSGHVEFYARLVQNRALRRRLMEIGGKIAQLAYQEEDAQSALEQAEQLLADIALPAAQTDFRVDRDILDAYLLRLMEGKEHPGQIIGVPTGYRDLDYLLGGLHPQDLDILAARPAVGKSSWALSVAAHNVLREEKTVAVFSLEMSAEQLIGRLLSMDTGLSMLKQRNRLLEDQDWESVLASRDRLAVGRLWIDDTCGISLPTMRRKIQVLHRMKVYPDLIIVDYLQLIGTLRESKGENREQEVSRIARGLKNLAREFNVPVLALAQLSRAVESRQSKVPQLSDLRESGSIEQEADVVMFIYRDDMYNPETERPNLADIIVAKHRHGETNEIELYFEKERVRFCNVERTNP